MRPGWDTPPRHALVLAGGGIVGGLYEVGALVALDALFDGFTTCDFDLYIGSSAGAFLAALLANQVSPEAVRATLESDRATLPRLTGAQFLSVPWRRHLETIARLAAAIPRLALELATHWGDVLVLDSLGALAHHLPHGLFTLEGLEAYVRHVLTRGGRSDRFTELPRRLLVPATVLDTGATHVFGLAHPEATPISAAVAASAAIPVLFEPVRIDGIDYVDAAVTETAHERLATDHCAGLVVMVNPLRPLAADHLAAPIRESGLPAIAGQALRTIAQRRLHDSLLRVQDERPDLDLVVLEPYAFDGQLFGYSLMTYALRFEVIRRGFRTTAKTILADYDRHARQFARHGIGVVPRAEFARRAEGWSRDACAAAVPAGAGPGDTGTQPARRARVDRAEAASPAAPDHPA
jgi:predicted acylesterase/phospholipase RssA